MLQSGAAAKTTFCRRDDVNAIRALVTRVFGGGVGQVEATAAVVRPAHELDRDPAAGGVDQLLHLQTQAAVFCCTGNTGSV